MLPVSAPPRRIARNAVLVLLGVCLVLGSIWRFTSLHQTFGFGTLVRWASIVRGHPWTPIGMIAIYIAGGLLFFVHALLLWVTVFAFDPIHAFIYCELGS